MLGIRIYTHDIDGHGYVPFVVNKPKTQHNTDGNGYYCVITMV